MTAALSDAHPALGALADGTPFFVPCGQVAVAGDRVICHLCGRAFRSVTAHLRVHGWTKQDYCTAFGLERGQSLEGQETRKLRAAAFTARLIFDPAIRAGSATGRERARSGQLARDAAAAATGRQHPQQRRQKAAGPLTGAAAAAAGRANAERAQQRLAATAAAVAHRHGYPDLDAFVLAGVASGASLAALSRASGLNKDWLSRHLAAVAPAAAAALPAVRSPHAGQRLTAAVSGLGFADVADYLRDRHAIRHWTVSAIAREAGVSPPTVRSALERHGISREAHAARRHDARARAAQVAVAAGVSSVSDYIAQRRATGLTWRAIAAECGQPESWLRRRRGA